MKRILLILFVAVIPGLHLPARNADSLAFAGADWHWQDMGRGVRTGYASMELFGSTQSISVVRYPAARHRTFLICAHGADAAPTDSLAIRAGAGYALNGSYFNMKTLESSTFFARKGKVLSPTCCGEQERVNGLLAIRHRNGRKIDILPYEKDREDYYRRHYHASLASGPLLLKDGKTADFDLDSRFVTDRHPRSFIGLTGDGYVYLVVVDGRFPSRADGASISELAAMAGWLGLRDALNVDGGGSSAVWTGVTGILNHPSDNRRFDHRGARRVPNIIAVR